MSEPIDTAEFGRAAYEAAQRGGADPKEAMTTLALARRDARHYNAGDHDQFTFAPDPERG